MENKYNNMEKRISKNLINLIQIVELEEMVKSKSIINLIIVT